MAYFAHTLHTAGPDLIDYIPADTKVLKKDNSAECTTFTHHNTSFALNTV